MHQIRITTDPPKLVHLLDGIKGEFFKIDSAEIVQYDALQAISHFAFVTLSLDANDVVGNVLGGVITNAIWEAIGDKKPKNTTATPCDQSSHHADLCRIIEKLLDELNRERTENTKKDLTEQLKDIPAESSKSVRKRKKKKRP